MFQWRLETGGKKVDTGAGVRRGMENWNLSTEGGSGSLQVIRGPRKPWAEDHIELGAKK